MGADKNWRLRSMCDGLDPDEIEAKFFPHPNSDAEEAKAICRVCPVAADCLTYALETRQEFGVWGAMTERERAALLVRAGQKAPASASPRCGTYSGYSRHRKLRERLCEPCRLASVAYEKDLRARKRQEMSA